MIQSSKRGFTLIELMVVISIIGFLASLTLAGLNSARERARIAKFLADTKQIKLAIELYRTDTGFTPSTCAVLHASLGGACSESNDPFLNGLGVLGWNGPYFRMWNNTHGWKGQMGIFYRDFILGDGGQLEYGILYNDDRPGTDPDDNQGLIPTNVLEELDETLDDGNLSTGIFRGDGTIWGGFSIPVGEAFLLLNDADCSPNMSSFCIPP